MLEETPKHENNPRMEEIHLHMKAARKEFRASFETLMPKGFHEHRKAARKEMLLALKSLVDAAIERTEK
jgi:hypothetical protein